MFSFFVHLLAPPASRQHHSLSVTVTNQYVPISPISSTPGASTVTIRQRDEIVTWKSMPIFIHPYPSVRAGDLDLDRHDPSKSGQAMLP